MMLYSSFQKVVDIELLRSRYLESTFTRHVQFLSDQNILETIFNELIDVVDLPSNNIIMTDTFAIPSRHGSEGLGYCYKYMSVVKFL